MNKDYETVIYKMYFHMENVPKLFQEGAKKEFLKARNVCAPIFNDMIGDVNKEWGRTGKPATFGPNYEDINPEYVEFISERIQPRFDEVAQRLWLRVWITFDKYGDLIGYMPQVRDSKIWVDFKPCEF